MFWSCIALLVRVLVDQIILNCNLLNLDEANRFGHTVKFLNVLLHGSPGNVKLKIYFVIVRV